jgi:hypothetical protein
VTPEQRAKSLEYRRQYERMLHTTDEAYRTRKHVSKLSPEKLARKREIERESQRRSRARKRAERIAAQAQSAAH